MTAGNSVLEVALRQMQTDRARLDAAIAALSEFLGVAPAAPVEASGPKQASPPAKPKTRSAPCAPGEKRCKECGNVKATSDFHRNGAFTDGLNNRCKPCVKAMYQASKGKGTAPVPVPVPSPSAGPSGAPHTCELCNSVCSSEERYRKHQAVVHNRSVA